MLKLFSFSERFKGWFLDSGPIEFKVYGSIKLVIIVILSRHLGSIVFKPSGSWTLHSLSNVLVLKSKFGIDMDIKNCSSFT